MANATSRYTVTTYTRVYGPMDTDSDGDPVGDERPTLTVDCATHAFDTLREVADYLDTEGLSSPSIDPGPFPLSTWVCLDDGSRPHRRDGKWSAVIRTVVGARRATAADTAQRGTPAQVGPATRKGCISTRCGCSTTRAT
jgi:hypothetical protein